MRYDSIVIEGEGWGSDAMKTWAPPHRNLRFLANEGTFWCTKTTCFGHMQMAESSFISFTSSKVKRGVCTLLVSLFITPG